MAQLFGKSKYLNDFLPKAINLSLKQLEVLLVNDNDGNENPEAYALKVCNPLTRLRAASLKDGYLTRYQATSIDKDAIICLWVLIDRTKKLNPDKPLLCTDDFKSLTIGVDNTKFSYISSENTIESLAYISNTGFGVSDILLIQDTFRKNHHIEKGKEKESGRHYTFILKNDDKCDQIMEELAEADLSIPFTIALYTENEGNIPTIEYYDLV